MLTTSSTCCLQDPGGVHSGSALTEMSDMPTAYAYSRFSSAEQRKGDSARRQRDRAEKYAAKHGLTLDTELTLDDEGISAFRGKNAATGNLRAFLDLVEDGQIEPGSFLLLENLDRLSRQTARKALRLLEELVEAGITVVTLQNGRRYDSKALDEPLGLMEVLFTFFRSHDESRTKSQRIRDLWEKKREEAADKPMTAKCPGWLKLDKQERRFIVIEERADIVRRIYTEALEGRGQHLIAETLNREGVPVFGRGKHWHSTYVTKLLKEPAVVGSFTPHILEHADTGRKVRKPQQTITDYFPPIVEQEIYDRVQSMRNGAGTPLRGRHASKEVRNLFGGLACCGRCGATVTRVYKGAAPKGGEYLVCTAAKSGAGCKYQTVRYGRVEDAFLRDAEAIIATAPAGDDSALDKELLNIDGALSSLKDRHENILDAIERGGWSADLDKRRREVERQRDALQEQERALLTQKHEATGAILSRKLDDLRAALGATPLDRTRTNAIMRQTFSSITVDYESGWLVFAWRHGGESAGAVFGWPEDSEDAA